MKKTILFILLILSAVFGRAVQLNPVVGYVTDQNGQALTNWICTISAWPATNYIVGNSTNLVATRDRVLLTDVNGYISNSLAAGNYRLSISNYVRGITFGVVNTNTIQIISQSAGVPVVTFLNYTLAQFSDAGTMARESTNNWTRNSLAGVAGALGYTPGTNASASVTAGTVFTNGNTVWLTYRTNGLIGSAYTNLPWGSIATTTNGQFFVLSNSTWLIK